MAIPRHRTALTRGVLSKPIRYAIHDAIIAPGATVLDYGCGRGSDVARLRALGYDCFGWDPHLAPDGPLRVSHVVNLGYVVNVIESQAERVDALTKAWALTAGVLIVTARLKFDVVGQELIPFEDGYLTTRGTFQKFFDHSELQHWVTSTLGAPVVAAGPGRFYVFRDPTAREAFLATRQRRPATTLRPARSEVLFDQYRALFEAVLPFVGARGRLPSVKECPSAAALYEAVPRLDTILAVVSRSVGEQLFEQVVTERKQDLLVYLALSRFERRPSLQQLSSDLQLDIRSFFPSYREACAHADSLLFQVGQHRQREESFTQAKVGKLTGNSLYVHASAVPHLPVLLRLYEGCARGYIGTVEGTTVVKLHRHEPRVSYLSYPRFDREPHPCLIGSLIIDLKRLSVRYLDYSDREDPPVLHRKELFVAVDYPRRQMFANLTKSEESHGLLSQSTPIGTKRAWEAVMRSQGYGLRGHRLVKIRTNIAKQCGAESSAAS